MKPMLFGKYCLLERISVGGMAEVFRAKPFDSPDFKGYLALKRILPHLAEDDEFIKMFVDEAKLTVQLQHPNIVRIYELGQFQSSYYILMEFISGKDVLALQKTVRRRREVIPVRQAMFIAREIARGLHFAHHKRDADGNPLNIIHRDVSPQNVLIDYRGRVKVIDFGIAKAAVQSTRTQVGVLKGKMGYMSPEQVRGEPLDYRSDVFAIGTVLWEMLTNRRLFHAENEFETMQMVREARAELPSSLHDELPADVDEIVMNALTSDPENRWASAGAFATAIDSWLEEHPFTAEDLSVWMRTVYADDLEAERSKREQFATIVSAEDVRQLQQEAREEKRREGEGPVAGEVVDEPEPVAASADGEETPPLLPPDEAADTDPGIHGEARTAEPSEEVADDEEPKTEIWDADILPDEGQNLAEFAAQHTVVQAGGFDASLIEDDDGLDELSDGRDAIDTPVVATNPDPTDTPVPASDTPLDPAPTPGAPDAHRSDQLDQPGPIAQPAVGPTPGGQPLRAADEFVDDGTQPGARSKESPPVAFYAIAAICVILALAGAVSVAALLAMDFDGEADAAATSTATLVVNATPPTELEILLDGKVVGDASPHTVEGVEIGTHVLEVKRRDYEPYSETIEVDGDGVVPITVELVPTIPPEGTIVLRLPDDRTDLGVYLDGERQIVESEGDLEFTLLAGKHLVEATRPDYRPWSALLHVNADVRKEEIVELTPVARDFEIRADQNASVWWNGKRLGVGPSTVEDVDPRKIHELRVEVRSMGVSTWRSAIGYPQIAKSFIVVDFDRPLPPSYRERQFGWLQISTGDDWWEVLIDGVETGLITPIDARGKIPVAAGKHQITLRRGDTEHHRDVRIVGGETFLMREQLAFEFSGDAG